MRTFVKETTWLSSVERGWGNGYVVIPKGHPLHGKGYDEIDVDVHGGLTFAELAKDLKKWDEVIDHDKGGWVVGFDTCHLDDTSFIWTKTAVEAETGRLKQQLEKL